jgi:hypothetical protein
MTSCSVSCKRGCIGTTPNEQSVPTVACSFPRNCRNLGGARQAMFTLAIVAHPNPKPHPQNHQWSERYSGVQVYFWLPSSAE